MRQLSEQDAALLDSDSGHANANVSLLFIYDQSTVPGGTLRFKSILAHVESRLGGAVHWRRRLLRVPMELDRPYWVEDEHFDLEYHVRHIALPKPGDWRQFCIQVSRIHARALDLDRPLWELYVIEGLDAFLDLPAGSFAVMVKTHQAAFDPGRDTELATLLHDLRADAPPVRPPPPWFGESAPSTLPLVARGLMRAIAAPGRTAGPLARRLMRAAPATLALAGDLMLHGRDLVPTRFNSVVSPHRVFETRRFALDEVDRIRAAVPGSTLHDVVLALCGGALQFYLDGHGEAPAHDLLAAVPVPAPPRGDEPAEPAWMRVAMHADLADPLERLRAVQADRATGQALAAASPGAAGRLSRAVRQLGRSARRAPLAHCRITWLPGPEQPLYLCGARMSWCSAMLPIADGMGLAFAAGTCDGKLVISPTSCRELMPDPERFATCLREGYQALLAAAEAPRRSRRRAGAAAA